MSDSDTRALVECTDCDGSGTVQALAADPDIEEPTGTYDDLQAADVDCDRCGGRGTEYEGIGCPRCGASSDALSSMLLPSGCYDQSCSECPWSEVVG